MNLFLLKASDSPYNKYEAINQIFPPYKKKRSCVRVESVLDVADQRRIWYNIEGFNGYQISNDLWLRSMKMKHEYPFGILIRPSLIRSDRVAFNLTNSAGQHVTITLDKLMEIVEKSNYITSVHSNEFIPNGRNAIRVGLKGSPTGIEDPRAFMPKFTII